MLYQNIFNKFGIIGFQSPASPIMEAIIDFHNDIFFFLILVLTFVLWMFSYILYNYYVIPTYYYEDLNLIGLKNNNFLFNSLNLLFFKSELNKKLLFFKNNNIENTSQLISYLHLKSFSKYPEILKTREIEYSTNLELVWTIIPSFILVSIAIPSFYLLYQMEEIVTTRLTIKVVGYQWFWTYEYVYPHEDSLYVDYFTDSYGYNLRVFKNDDVKLFDSVMLPESELSTGYHRLLEVDHQLVLPVGEDIRILVTAADVLHSWAVPSLGVKIDAVPGRLSQVFLFLQRQGVFYGQCSELCGVNHGFMPIVIKAVNVFEFARYTTNVEEFWWSDFFDEDGLTLTPIPY
jgi:cytochrome c oxidase subunit 2